MDLFTLAAPIFDLAMEISGHNEVLVELGNRIKKDELKNYSNGSKNLNFAPSDREVEKQAAELLDLGGGTGELVKYLPKNLRITVADPSEAMLTKGKKKNFEQPVEHVLADGADLPFADNRFDYLVISDALHHFQQVKAALNESVRVLKSGGKMYILEFNPETFFTKTIIFFEKLAGEPVNFYKPEVLASFVDQDNLEMNYEYLNKSLYIMCIQKKIML